MVTFPTSATPITVRNAVHASASAYAETAPQMSRRPLRQGIPPLREGRVAAGHWPAGAGGRLLPLRRLRRRCSARPRSAGRQRGVGDGARRPAAAGCVEVYRLLDGGGGAEQADAGGTWDAWGHSASLPGLTKNSSSICSNSRERKV